MTTKNKILVVVAHSGDETFGCGGTSAHHVRNNDKVFCISFTNGVGVRFDNNKNEYEIKKRKASALKAQKILGFRWLEEYCADFPDNSLDTVSMLELIKIIEQTKKKIKPDIIYTHSNTDLNVDHRKISEATVVAFRPQPGENWKEIRFFEIPSSTEYSDGLNFDDFKPNLFINIKTTLKKKLTALKAYSSELRDYPHPRSLKGIKVLAQHRGVQNGLEYAEAFKVVKKIVR